MGIIKISGIPIITIPDTMLPGGEWCRVKTHKKKRIDKKYKKRYGSVYRAPSQLYKFDNGIYCPESRIKSIKKKLSKDGEFQKWYNAVSQKPFSDLI